VAGGKRGLREGGVCVWGGRGREKGGRVNVCWGNRDGEGGVVRVCVCEFVGSGYHPSRTRWGGGRGCDWRVLWVGLRGATGVWCRGGGRQGARAAATQAPKPRPPLNRASSLPCSGGNLRAPSPPITNETVLGHRPGNPGQHHLQPALCCGSRHRALPGWHDDHGAGARRPFDSRLTAV
jgi:hypothetical protein